MQRYLTDALHSDNPRTALLERLATLLSAAVGLVGPRGTVLLKAGGWLPGSADGLATHLSDGPAVRQERVADSWALVVRVPDGDRESDPVWLVAASASAMFINRLTRSAMQAAAPLVSAVDRLDTLSRIQERMVRAAVLRDIHAHAHLYVLANQAELATRRALTDRSEPRQGTGSATLESCEAGVLAAPPRARSLDG